MLMMAGTAGEDKTSKRGPNQELARNIAPRWKQSGASSGCGESIALFGNTDFEGNVRQEKPELGLLYLLKCGYVDSFSISSRSCCSANFTLTLKVSTFDLRDQHILGWPII